MADDLIARLSQGSEDWAGNSLENYLGAITAMARGEQEVALERLEKFVKGETGYTFYQEIEKHTAFESLRDDPRFVSIIENMKSNARAVRSRLPDVTPETI